MAIDRDAALKRAEKFLRQGKLDGAIEEYVRLVEDQPRDWASVNALGDLYARAGNPDRAAEQFTRLADFLFQEGFLPKAQAVYKKTLKVNSTHEHTMLQLIEIAVRQGLLVDARQHLRQLQEQRRLRGDARGASQCVVRLGMLEDADIPAKLAAAQAAEQIGDTELAANLLNDPDLLLALAGREFAAGQDQQALQRITRVITQAPERGPDVVRLAKPLVDANQPERAFACVDIVADTALLEGDVQRAADILHEFVKLAPHIPALTKLVDLCVDGGFHGLMREAQTLLADAYVKAGREAEAQAITDDLNGVAATDIVGDDFLADLGEPSGPPPPEPEMAEPVHVEPVQVEPAKVVMREPPPADDRVVIESLEIDLSDILSGLEGAPVLPPLHAAAAYQEAPAPTSPPGPAPALEAVFEEMRSKASREELTADAADHFDRALLHLGDGQEDEAIDLLQRAARVPAYRFRAASELADVLLRRGNAREGIEWLERAAEAPAPAPEAGFALLYQLGATLESVGESARALAVLMELDADAPGYRDVGERIARLTREQTESHTP